jgi:hypothetical protein
VCGGARLDRASRLTFTLGYYTGVKSVDDARNYRTTISAKRARAAARRVRPPKGDLLPGRTRHARLLVLCMLASIVACDDFAPGTTPSPSPAVEVIAVGQQVNRTFTGLTLNFEVLAPRNGILVSTLTWNRSENGSTLLLSVNGATFLPSNTGRFPAHVISRLQVAAGETIRIAVSAGGTDVTYDDPFVLATTLE